MILTDRLIVVWRVFSGCNLNCGFCGYAKNFNKISLVAQAEEVIRIAQVLSEYQNHYERKVHLSFLGGEPLLWKDFAYVSSFLKHQLNLSLGTTSNGSALSSPKMRTLIIKNLDLLTLSLDGPDSFHDSLRDSQGLFANIKAAIFELKKADLDNKLKIRINAVLMRKNLSLFSELCEEVAEWGIDSISFNQLGGRDRPEFFPDNKLELEAFTEFQKELNTLRVDLRTKGVILLGTQTYLDRILSSIKGDSIELKDCQAGKDFIFIDEIGRISPCSFTGSDFNLLTRDISSYKDINILIENLSQRQKTSNFKACKDCLSTQKFGKFEYQNQDNALGSNYLV